MTRVNIELCTLPPLDAVKIPADKIKAIMEKFGLKNLKHSDYPPHLQSFVEEIVYAIVCVQEIVDFGRYAALGKYRDGLPNWKYFTKWYYAGGMEELESFEFKNECDTLPTAQDPSPMPVDGVVGGDPAAAECGVDDDDLEDEISNKDDLKDETSNEDDLKDEIFELLLEIEEALDNIELRTLPLDAVKILGDQLEALLKKLGLDNVKCGDYPPHLQSFGKDIEFLKVRVHETADFGKLANIVDDGLIGLTSNNGMMLVVWSS
ncbi:uncharacterized protein LOC113275684 isoform X1 [Papaver somniferum]|uniref:uncharacterized protein LOC113275684 isoform X1 n=1 Tax=Papaver somniferum TaxID=3469 RepID=UPI000E6F7584|nr:uncharacterized protein LOC113275684 isoform X1 [Papaver somniferum]